MQVYIYTNTYQYTPVYMHACTGATQVYTIAYAGIATPVYAGIYAESFSIADKTDTSGEASLAWPRGQTLFAQVLIDLDIISAGRL